MTPYERLLAEAIPTRPPAKPPTEPWTTEEQAQHLADLLDALNGWHWDDDPRHLRLIHDTNQTAA